MELSDFRLCRSSITVQREQSDLGVTEEKNARATRPGFWPFCDAIGVVIEDAKTFSMQSEKQIRITKRGKC